MGRNPIVVAAVVLVVVLGACDWGQPRYGPERHGNNPGETAITAADVGSLTERWHADVAQPGPTGGPLVAGGRAFVVANGAGGGDSTVTAVDADTGAELWSRTYEGPGDPEYFSPSLSMTTAGGMVLVGRIFGSGFGGFEALDAATGAVRWTSSFGPGVIEPVVRDGVVYAGYLELGGPSGTGFTTGVVALEAATGAPLWRSVGSTLQRPNVAVRGDRAYVGVGNELQVFDADGVEGCSGSPSVCTPLWTGTLGDGLSAAFPVVTETSVYVVTENDLRVFPSAGCGAATCTATWTADPAGRIWAPAGLSRDKVLVSTDDGLQAYPAAGCGAATCTPAWTGTGGAPTSAPSSGNGVVFVGASDGHVRAYAAAGCGAATCAPLWTSPDMGGGVSGAPAVADGRVVAGSTGGLRSFGLPAPA